MQRIPPFKTLDFFRGFAAIWVVMVHCCDRWLPSADPKYLQQPLYAFSIRGQLGVMIFFVISGYCIVAAAYSALLQGKNIWRYSFDRIRRIYPPYLAALILTGLSVALIAFASSHHLIGPVNHPTTFPWSFRYWVANLLLLQYELDTPMANVVFWSLGYEIAFYCLIGFFLIIGQWFSRKRDLQVGVELLLWCLGISTMASLGWMLLFGNAPFPFDSWHQFSIGGLLFFLLEMKPSTVTNYGGRFQIAVWANVAGVTILTLLYSFLRQVGEVDIGHPSSGARSLVCLAFALCLIPLRKVDQKVATYPPIKAVMWVGLFSYSLYLTHPIILPYVDIMGRKMGLNGDRYWIAFWLQVIVAVGFGRLFYWIVERHFISKKQVQRIRSEHISSIV